jgi:hypothetical protein
LVGVELGSNVQNLPPCFGIAVGISEGWMVMVSGSWISLGVGDIVGTDVDLVGFLVGLRWVGRLVGLTTGARDVVGRPVGLRVTGFLVGLGAIASAALNDRSSIAKYSLVTGAGESVITLVLVKSQNVKGNNLATWRCW